MVPTMVPTTYESPVFLSTATSVILTSILSSLALMCTPQTKSWAPYWKPLFCSEMQLTADVDESTSAEPSGLERTANGDSLGPGCASTVTGRSPFAFVPSGVTQMSLSCCVGPPLALDVQGLQEPPQLLPVSSPSMQPRTVRTAPAACGVARVPACALKTVRLATLPSDVSVAVYVVAAVTLIISSSILMYDAIRDPPPCPAMPVWPATALAATMAVAVWVTTPRLLLTMSMPLGR
mmetsp:Transcript_31762/g.80797  ORF Transcript_31762/g.80797 Transcript_31762/m.80797 type:complete len:236 (-) Transcript_31762:4230-4937(-)